MDRGACEQAERKSSTSTLTPDLDNANVGSESAIVFDQREMPNGVSRFLFFCPWNLKEEREGCKMHDFATVSRKIT